ncbi:DVU3141 family protein [Pseudodesulfovibrio indicus]|uniref:DVU3141 family protein n=1 Tax=Pseudodesulfovibrio indicus TaxID=1716143 RepID=UPI002930EF3F|nr:DVU3141 family protein [Pseudodesulfovibrio indicus]
MYRGLLLLLLFFVLPACSSHSSDPSLPEEQVQAPEPVRPLAQFAATAKVNASDVVKDEKYGEITVIAGNFYFSAAGEWCRMLLVTQGTCSFELVFRRAEGGSWEEVPLLHGCDDSLVIPGSPEQTLP